MLHGDVPSAVSPPAGCRFHPRCRHATDICRTEDLGGPEVEVDDEESPISARRELRVADFLAKHLPGAVGPVAFSRACLYELPADRDFILGPLPGEPRVRVAIGGGHAAKFAARLGLVLSEMVLDGASHHPVAPFRVERLRR